MPGHRVRLADQPSQIATALDAMAKFATFLNTFDS
jgi:hypothetical protein